MNKQLDDDLLTPVSKSEKSVKAYSSGSGDFVPILLDEDKQLSIDELDKILSKYSKESRNNVANMLGDKISQDKAVTIEVDLMLEAKQALLEYMEREKIEARLEEQGVVGEWLETAEYTGTIENFRQLRLIKLRGEAQRSKLNGGKR